MKIIVAVAAMAIALLVMVIMLPGFKEPIFGLITMVACGWAASLIYRSKLGKDEPYQIVRKGLIATLSAISIVQPYAIYCGVQSRHFLSWARTLDKSIHAGMTADEVTRLLSSRARITEHKGQPAQEQVITFAPRWPVIPVVGEWQLTLQYDKDGRLAKYQLNTLDW